MNSISDQKAAARNVAYAKRQQAHKLGLDRLACAHLQEFLKTLPDAQIFAAYMPIRTEVSPLSVMTYLVEQGKQVCVPVIQGKGQALLFQNWTPEGEMMPGPFGAKVPKSGAWLEPSVVITPLLAFDNKGFRLGYGGGFYDRTFAKLRAKQPIIGVGFAYGAQEVDAVPTEPTDQPVDVMVTDQGIQRF